MAYVFNDTTYADQGLIQECEDICNLGEGGISGNTAKLRTFTRRLNIAKDRFYLLAQKYGILWPFDEVTQTDLPIFDTDLESGIPDYALDGDIRTVIQVFAKDSNGTVHELLPQDDRTAPNSYLTDEGGTPTHYELVGNSLMLYPIPNYTTVDGFGLTVVGEREGVKFTTGSGTAAIGVPSMFFDYLANHASYPYCTSKSLKHSPAVLNEILKGELALANHISNRAKPKRSGIRIHNESNK
jgi:hypothetical protein